MYRPGTVVWIPNFTPAKDEAEVDAANAEKLFAGAGPYDAQGSAYRTGWMPHQRSLQPLFVPMTVYRANKREREVQLRGTALGGKFEGHETPAIPVDLRGAAAFPFLVNDIGAFGVDNMEELKHLHLPGVLNNVTRRFLDNEQIYTFAGKTLIAVNPNRSVTLQTAGWAPLLEILCEGYDSVERTAVSTCHVYDDVVVDLYLKAAGSLASLPPHIFAVAQRAYNYLQSESGLQAQSIVFVGDSGSGKSSQAKAVLQYFANAFGLRPDGLGGNAIGYGASPTGSAPLNAPFANTFRTEGLSTVAQRMLDAHVLLEAFGGACTSSNFYGARGAQWGSGSSRYSSSVQVAFDPSGALARANFGVFGLEQSRLTSTPAGEGRNFNVFYQLINGMRSRRERDAIGLLERVDDYAYLRTARGLGPEVDPATDGAAFEQLRVVMAQSFGIEGELQLSIFKLLAAILTLGNVQFRADDDSGRLEVNDVLNDFTDLLEGMDTELLTDLLTTRARQSRGNVTTVHLDVAQAEKQRDSLARDLYRHLFAFIVDKVNEKLDGASGRHDPASTITLVDTFGFENNPTNGLEALVRNYASERFESYYRHCEVEQTTERYEAEGINWRVDWPTDYERSAWRGPGQGRASFEPVFERCASRCAEQLINGQRPRGVLGILAEKAKFERSTDKLMHTEIELQHRENPAFARGNEVPPSQKAKLFESAAETHIGRKKQLMSFAVRHSGGSAETVSYLVEGFLHDNKRRMDERIAMWLYGSPSVLLQVVIRSPTSPSLSHLEQSAGGSSSSPKRGEATASVPKSTMSTLETVLRQVEMAEAHFVRCVRPNAALNAQFVAPQTLARQLRPVLPTLQLARDGFAYSRKFEDFYRDYLIVVEQTEVLCYPPRADIDIVRLCTELFVSLCRMMRCDLVQLQSTGQVQFGCDEFIFMSAEVHTRLEALKADRLAKMESAAATIARRWRGYMHRLRYTRMAQGLEKMQAAWRAAFYNALWRHRMSSVRAVQRFVKSWVTRAWYRDVRRAAVTIQSFFRRQVGQIHGKRERNAIRVMHSLAEGFYLRRQVLLALEATVRVQRTVRAFLKRSRVHWDCVRLALYWQSWYRGMASRRYNFVKVQALAQARRNRTRGRAVAQLEHLYRTVRRLSLCSLPPSAHARELTPPPPRTAATATSLSAPPRADRGPPALLDASPSGAVHSALRAHGLPSQALRPNEGGVDAAAARRARRRGARARRPQARRAPRREPDPQPLRDPRARGGGRRGVRGRRRAERFRGPPHPARPRACRRRRHRPRYARLVPEGLDARHERAAGGARRTGAARRAGRVRNAPHAGARLRRPRLRVRGER